MQRLRRRVLHLLHTREYLDDDFNFLACNQSGGTMSQVTPSPQCTRGMLLGFCAAVAAATIPRLAHAAPDFPYGSQWVGGRYERPETWVSAALALGVRTPRIDEAFDVPAPPRQFTGGFDVRLHLNTRWEAVLVTRFGGFTKTVKRLTAGSVEVDYLVRSKVFESTWFIGGHREWIGSEHYALVAGPQIGFMQWRANGENGWTGDSSEMSGTDLGVALHVRASAFIDDRIELGPAVRFEASPAIARDDVRAGATGGLSIQQEFMFMVGLHL